jgi:polyisoprenoid-binding protein YceI
MTTAAPSLVIPDATWAIDPVHSSVGFEVKHLGVSTYRGNFPGVSGTITSAAGHVTAVDGSTEIKSLVTQDQNLTGHLFSPDFFDADNHPTGRFVATKVTQGASGEITIDGDLTLRGITKPAQLVGEVEGVGPDPYGNTRIGISVSGKINRTQYGINWNAPLDNGMVAVAETVKLVWHVEAIAQ